MGSFWALAGLSLATIGFYGMKTSFWPLPSTFLSGTAAAAAIAGINSLGNLGGLIGPNAVAWFRDHTGTFATRLGRFHAVLAPGLNVVIPFVDRIAYRHCAR